MKKFTVVVENKTDQAREVVLFGQNKKAKQTSHSIEGKLKISGLEITYEHMAEHFSAHPSLVKRFEVKGKDIPINTLPPVYYVDSGDDGGIRVTVPLNAEEKHHSWVAPHEFAIDGLTCICFDIPARSKYKIQIDFDSLSEPE
jgi:hypothetical protein